MAREVKKGTFWFFGSLGCFRTMQTWAHCADEAFFDNIAASGGKSHAEARSTQS